LQVVAQDGGVAKEAQVKKTETGSDKSASSKSSESKEGTAAADKDKSAAGRSAADDKDAKSPESGGSKSSGANADNGGSGSSGSEKNPGASGTNPGGNGNSKGNSGGGSSSGEGSNAGSGDSGSGAKPKPKREWVPPRDEWVESGHWETKKIKHPAEYGERNIIGARCNDCGFTTAIASEMYAHLEKTFHSGYTTGVVIGTEKYVIKKAWIEEKKVWVDTSRWVHHPGYWKE
jgi:hypothetical protein